MNKKKTTTKQVLAGS